MVDLQKAKELADAHWSYVEGVLKSADMHQDHVSMCEFHYKSAFIHGYKHAIEDNNNEG